MRGPWAGKFGHVLRTTGLLHLESSHTHPPYTTFDFQRPPIPVLGQGDDEVAHRSILTISEDAAISYVDEDEVAIDALLRAKAVRHRPSSPDPYAHHHHTDAQTHMHTDTHAPMRTTLYTHKYARTSAPAAAITRSSTRRGH